jgi:hypothetical protein
MISWNSSTIKVVLGVFFGILAIVVGSHITQVVLESKEQREEHSKIDPKRQTELGVVKLDLGEYEYLSDEVRGIILNSIDSASSRYKVPVMLLHAVLRIESEYKFWVVHPKVSVRVKLDSVKYGRVETNALGLGGVIWEIWGKELKSSGIANSKGDLLLPDKNIFATAFILRYLINKNSSKANHNNAIPLLISEYYGAFDSGYESKMVRFTSDLFWKRITREIVQGD